MKQIYAEETNYWTTTVSPAKSRAEVEELQGKDVNKIRIVIE